MTNVVIVESPAKAKTINKYLGSDFRVLATVGHIRDLIGRDGSVKPDSDFEMDWEIFPDSQKQIKEIANALNDADNLYLATDPDREGEAISWHLKEILKEKNLLSDVKVQRVVFNEVTEAAVLDAFNNPRDLDNHLVEAYLARRALDHLVGFKLSPVLWRKLPGNKSAGRVQSVALRLICERELEIEKFDPREYWSVLVNLENSEKKSFSAKLTHLAGKKLGDYDLSNEELAKKAVASIEGQPLFVLKVEKKQVRDYPRAPFTTSTLQQAAANKLYFTAKKTMSVAQSLYQGVNINGETLGLITYMRTDGVSMSAEAIISCRDEIKSQYGKEYLPDSPNIYKVKAKNAQEAHEAIRPTNIAVKPGDVKMLDEDQQKLYGLIWNKAIASQMQPAVFDRVAVDLGPSTDTDEELTLRANGSVLIFDGHKRIYDDESDSKKKEGETNLLPKLLEGEKLTTISVKPEQHFTKPPARYSEASLIKHLEELGIGRPSTYSSIMSKLKENYVRIENRRFFPEDRSRLVTAFLTIYFSKYVQYDFTADLEEKLDRISDADIDWKEVLRDFWIDFNKSVEDTTDLRNREILDALNDIIGPHFFGPGTDGEDPRKCPTCPDGRVSLKTGRHGAFIGCSNYPDCKYTRPLKVPNSDDTHSSIADNGPKVLGNDPTTDLEVTLRRGPYGFYVQLGEAEGKTKPKRASLTRDINPENLNLQTAIGLLSLPREVGLHTTENEMITAAIGRFGPYIKMGGTYVSLKEDSVLEIGLNRAIDLLADAPRRPAPVDIGKHPDDGKPITLKTGRYGPFVQHGSTKATLPKDEKDKIPSLELAIELIRKKSSKKKTASKKKSLSKKRTASKKKTPEYSNT
ncbi:MAG: DNA topoisomerase 1 [Alphaproteobacteria bacterium MarineAlpha3_Bin7]|nr:MAG: DNA topoisomerase 1 [Alphaproteobacteria bacterium MarineAlpha3_Bin7]